MRFKLTIAAAGLAAMLGAGAADAGPMAVAPLVAPAVQSGPAPELELVRGRCGFGAHRTYSGYCRLNRGFRGRMRARYGRWRRWRYY